VSVILLLTSNAQTPGAGSTVDTISIVQRVQQNTSTTVDLQITKDGTPYNATAAYVTVTSDDGTILIDHQAATPTTIGHFTYPLAAAQTATLDLLTMTWDLTIDGQPQYATTHVEVVGGYLFNLAALRSDRDLTDTTQYPTGNLADARTYAEQELERSCGITFVPRYKRLNVNGTGTNLLRLNDAPLRTVRSVTVDGTAWTDLTGVQVAGSFLNSTTTWPAGYGNISLAYEAGYDYPPAAISQAALILAKDYLVRGPLDDRAIQRATEDGPVFIATPGWNGNRFGIPAVDAVIDSYRTPSIA
jgi:hypothetical protein